MLVFVDEKFFVVVPHFIDFQEPLEETIAGPPAMIEGVTTIARNVGDYKLVNSQ